METDPARSPRQRFTEVVFFVALFASGGLWWWVTHQLAPGAVGTGLSFIDLPAAMATGLLVGMASRPVYRRPGVHHLLWLAPLSLYLAAAVHFAIAYLTKLAIVRRGVTGTSWSPTGGSTVHLEGWATLLEGTLATWAGLSLPLFLALLLPLAFMNHLGLWCVFRFGRCRSAPQEARQALQP